VWFSTVYDAGIGRLAAIDATTLELTDAITLDVPVTGAPVAFESVWLSRLDGTLARHPLEEFAPPA